MKIHELRQGSIEWHEFRSKRRTASDAPAMMGASPYKTRNQLLQEKYTGVTPEVGSWTKKLYDLGHVIEALARALIEKDIGVDLYPVTGSHDSQEILAASFDGITLEGDIIYEHKMLNNAIRACEITDDLPLVYRIQMEQQLFVSGAKKCLFVATHWDAEELVEKRDFWYYPDLALRQQILDGWDQFASDLANYSYVEPKVEVIGRSPDALPALYIELSGHVAMSNLADFKEHALAVLATIKTQFDTDEDFANAEKTAKWCKEVESKLELKKQEALAQIQSIDALFKAIDEIKDEARQKRLALEKSVKNQKEDIRYKKVLAATDEFKSHVAALQKSTDVQIPLTAPDFGSVIKGLKTLSSIQNALDTKLAQEKINVNNFFKDWQKLNIAPSDKPNFEAIAAIAETGVKHLSKILEYRIQELSEKHEQAYTEYEAGRCDECVYIKSLIDNELEVSL